MDDSVALALPWGVFWDTRTVADRLVTDDDSAIEPVAVATTAAVSACMTLPVVDADMS